MMIRQVNDIQRKMPQVSVPLIRQPTNTQNICIIVIPQYRYKISDLLVHHLQPRYVF